MPISTRKLKNILDALEDDDTVIEPRKPKPEPEPPPPEPDEKPDPNVPQNEPPADYEEERSYVDPNYEPDRNNAHVQGEDPPPIEPGGLHPNDPILKMLAHKRAQNSREAKMRAKAKHEVQKKLSETK